ITVLAAELTNNDTRVVLSVSPLNSGSINEVTIDGVRDVLDNLADVQNATFQYILIETASAFEILINEIYADNDPSVALPEGKFVELYNRTDRYFQLNDYTFSDRVSMEFLPPYVLEPNSYVILCDADFLAEYSSLGPTIGLPNFPTPNISGDELSLRNQIGELLHEVDYSNDWYQDDIKQAGGWTLELINPNLFCEGATNWIASNDPSGGTPGRVNSVFQNQPDDVAPQLLSALPINNQQVQLEFSELLDAATTTELTNYVLSPSATAFPTTIELLADGRQVLLTFADPFEDRVDYTLTVSAIRDCPGNLIGTDNTASFVFIETFPAERYDLIINEIYADPSPSLGLPEREFLELYNRSDKAINLENYLFDKGSGTPQALPSQILLPDEYLILQRTDVFTNFSDFGT
ncbi:MAG: lamin tail domain-containing protein, partial [Bacteroidota bacterium]